MIEQDSDTSPEFQLSEAEIRLALCEEGDIIPELVVGSLRRFVHQREQGLLDADEDHSIAVPGR